ncbi:hydrolase 76 protein [Cladochytrium tenue]|nr:hydrolase 76 protein [Cladochytrium tenue]
MSGADLFGQSAIISSSAGASTSWFYVANFTLYEMLQDYDTICGGGVYWSRDRTSTQTNLRVEKSAITNAQIIWLATRLYNFVGDTAYLNVATSFWNWFVANSTEAGTNRIYDGVYALSATDCEVDGNSFSYYYGIMAAYGAVLTNITGDSTYLTTGLQYYDYWKTNFINASGHFYEPDCNNACKDPTGFNFPVYESLATLYNALPSTQSATKSEIKSLMATQGSYLVNYLTCDQTSWLCVRTLNPVPSMYTYANGTNPRDQLEMLSFVNAMVSINGAPVASSTPTVAAVATVSSTKSSGVDGAVSPLASVTLAVVTGLLAAVAAAACVAL